MINITVNDAHTAQRGTEWLEDAAEDRHSGYDFTREDRDSIKKLSKMQRGLLVTGDEQTEEEAEALLREVLSSEMDHWVPNASQRLINRAALILAGSHLLDPILEMDHGHNPGDHALTQDWVCGIFVLRCVTCARLFKI